MVGLLGEFPRHFGPPLGRGVGTAPPRWGGETLVQMKKIEHFYCSAFRHLQDLTHLLLDCPASEHLWSAIFDTTSSIFDLWSRPWGVVRLLGLLEFLRVPIPRKGSGSTTTNIWSNFSKTKLLWEVNLKILNAASTKN